MSSEDIYARIKRHEGFTRFPKPDAKGMFVLGYGHDIPPDQAKDYIAGIGETLAEQLLCADILLARNAVARMFPWASVLNQVRQDVLTEMCFQLGIDGLMGFHNFLFCLRSQDFVGACKAMLEGNTFTGMSEWYNETPDRCVELAEIMEKGE